MKLPKAEQDLEDWQAAVETLHLVVELNGPTMMALFEGALRERHPTEDPTPLLWTRPLRPDPDTA
jgi:hypothetical protein